MPTNYKIQSGACTGPGLIFFISAYLYYKVTSLRLKGEAIWHRVCSLYNIISFHHKLFLWIQYTI